VSLRSLLVPSLMSSLSSPPFWNLGLWFFLQHLQAAGHKHRRATAPPPAAATAPPPAAAMRTMLIDEAVAASVSVVVAGSVVVTVRVTLVTTGADMAKTWKL